MFNPTLVHEYLTLSAKRFPDKEALICGEERWTYRSIDQFSDQLACALVNMGMNLQDRIIVFLDNCAESVISLYGILKAGGTFVILNSSIKARKLSYILQDSGATIMITNTHKAEVVSVAIDGLQKPCRILWTGDSSHIPEALSSYSLSWNSLFQDLNTIDKSSQFEKVSNNSRKCIDIDLANLIYTSGSTGEPKGVMSSHQNMIAASRSIIQYLENTSEDVILNVLPLSFDYGLYQVIMAFMFGGSVVLEKSFLYPIRVLELLGKRGITGFPLVPTIVTFMLNMRNLNKYDVSSIRYMTNTAAALPVEHIRKLRTLMPQVRLYSMYGLTECKRVSYLPPEELDQRPSSVGKAIPNSEVFIVDENGGEVAPGEIGELVIRGAHVMQGYWNSPELTAKTFRNGRRLGERLLFSGDLFRQDEEGYLYFVGRKDDMIKTKGERVSPREIENVLCELEGVSEAAVIGIPDKILGQAIKAFIVNCSGVHLTGKKVLRHCTNQLEIFMVPKYMEFVQTLPRTPNGKIDKKSLKKAQKT
jgi:amino acid adenylation domain-containing protein